MRSPCKVKDRKDDVRLTSALAKIAEEDPALVIETQPEMGEMRLLGQGEMHLRVAVERLASRFQVGVETGKPRVGYCETIKLPASARGRHKKQTGGHGQFGDVMIEVRPLAARRGLRVPGPDHRRRRAAPVHPLGRDWRARRHQARAARLPGRRPCGDADGRLLPHGQFLRCRIPGGGAACARGGLPKVKPVLLEPVLSVEITISDGRSVEGNRPRHRPGAARSSATIPGPAGRAGTCSAR